jgi:hypothetical protein
MTQEQIKRFRELESQIDDLEDKINEMEYNMNLLKSAGGHPTDLERIVSLFRAELIMHCEERIRHFRREICHINHEIADL